MRADLPVVLWDSGLFPLPARDNSAHRIIVLFPLCVDLGGNERLEKDLPRQPAAELCNKADHLFNYLYSIVQEKCSHN